MCKSPPETLFSTSGDALFDPGDALFDVSTSGDVLFDVSTSDDALFYVPPSKGALFDDRRRAFRRSATRFSAYGDVLFALISYIFKDSARLSVLI